MAVVFAGAILAGSAQAATVSMTPVRTVGMGSFYSLSPDGTIWSLSPGSSGGAVHHYDNEGNDLGGGFTFSRNSFFPLSFAYYGGRVYIPEATTSSYTLLTSYQVEGGGPSHGFLFSDFETQKRTGSLGMYIRAGANGVATVAMGQNNKVATMNLADLNQEHPFYPQLFMGAGINVEFNPLGSTFESCSAGTEAVGGEAGTPANCGQHGGREGVEVGHLSYPIDVAPGNEGLYVAEKDGDRVTHINTGAGGPVADFTFGSGPGSGASQLDKPQSIVRQSSTGDLFVDDEGNRRISVFNAAGGYIATFGYGVHDGADTFEACGVEIGSCQAGVAYQSDSRSFFTRLDFAPNGDLYAYMPLRSQIQVFSLGEIQTTSGGANAGGGGGNPGGTTGPSKQPLKCKKGFKKKEVHGKAKCVKVKHHKFKPKHH